MSFSNRIGRLIGRFGLLAFATLLVVVAATSLLSVVAPTTAQTAPVAQSAQPVKLTDAVLDWNAIAQTATVQTAAAPPPQQFRTLAITHAAIFDAVNAIYRRYKPYAIDINAPVGASVEAATAAAAHGVLVRLYPAQQSTLEAALTASLAKVPEGQAKVDGVNVGREVAEKLVALRSNDGANKKAYYQPGTGVGIWQPTPPLFAPALLPYWSKVTPFAFKSLAQFKTPPPLALNSAAYAEDLNEVKRLGAKDSPVRTADQTAAAIWSAVSPITIWNAAARSAATAKGNSLIENARLFALLNFAGVDAYIAGYDVKYKYKRWRPATAIPNAAALGNPAITPDPNWESLIVTPAHLEYISGHCVTAGAAERTLVSFFGSDAVKVAITFPVNAGVTRSFTSFSQISKELGEA